jgi:hypothetical protein
MLNLEKDCELISKRPDERNWGDLVIQRGLKRRARRRVLKINTKAKEVLEQFVMESKGRRIRLALSSRQETRALGLAIPNGPAAR